MRSLLFLILSLISFTCLAQKEQRVFLWDVSESLKSNGMWKPLQDALVDGINFIDNDDESRIVLVPFYSQPLVDEIMDVPANADGKKRLIEFIKNRECKPDGLGSMTNIVDALKKFHQISKNEYLNYMFLYTDGKNELGNLGTELRSWNSKNASSNKYGFYVLVHIAADNKDVRAAEKNQDNFWVVPDAKQKIVICSIKDTWVKDVRETQKPLVLSVQGKTQIFDGDVDIQSNTNPYYQLKNIKTDIRNSMISFEISPKCNLSTCPKEYDLKINIRKMGGSPYSFITPQVIKVKCINKPIKILKIGIK